MEKQIEITVLKSEELAQKLVMIAAIVRSIDLDYLKAAAKEMHKQASWQEVAAVLNPAHPQIKNDILRANAGALTTLGKYIDQLKMIDELGVSAENRKIIIEDIRKQFL